MIKLENRPFRDQSGNFVSPGDLVVYSVRDGDNVALRFGMYVGMSEKNSPGILGYFKLCKIIRNGEPEKFEIKRVYLSNYPSCRRVNRVSWKSPVENAGYLLSKRAQVMSDLGMFPTEAI